MRRIHHSMLWCIISLACGAQSPIPAANPDILITPDWSIAALDLELETVTPVACSSGVCLQDNFAAEDEEVFSTPEVGGSQDVSATSPDFTPTPACPGMSLFVPATQVTCDFIPLPPEYEMTGLPPADSELRFSSMHRFDSGAILGLSVYSQRLWLIAPNGDLCEVQGAPDLPESSKIRLSSVAGGFEALTVHFLANGQLYARRFDAHGNVAFAATIPKPFKFTDYYAQFFDLAQDGTVFVTDNDKENLIVALGLDLQPLWQVDLSPFTMHAAAVTLGKSSGLGVVCDKGAEFHYRRYDGNGKLALDAPLTDPLSRMYLPGTMLTDLTGQMSAAQHVTSQDASEGLGKVLIRFDSNGNSVWVDAYATLSQLVSPSFSVASSTVDGGGMVAHGSYTGDPSPWLYFRHWSSTGRPSSVPMNVPAHFGLHAADNGYLLEAAAGLQRLNVEFSSTCKGCGPPAPDCDDGDPCTVDTCDPKLGDCTHQRNPGCKKSLGDCIAATDCDDGDPCTADTCDAKTGACSHPPQSECDTGNRCLGVKGTCSDGKCSPSQAKWCGLGKPLEGWAMALEGQHTQVFEGLDGSLMLAGGWVAERVQDNGIVRWRHVLDGGIAAATPTTTAGLVAAILQPEGKEVPGMTRLIRLSANGAQVWDKTIASGLDEWWLGVGLHPRRRWLVTKPDGGYVLLGHKAWSGDAWQGRMVSMSADATVTLAVDVTLTGIAGGPEDTGRAIDHVWAAPDGGLFVAWHAQVAGKSAYGGSRLDAQGKLVWTQAFASGTVQQAAFDRWRARGLLVTAPGKVQVVTFTLDAPALSPSTVPAPANATVPLSAYAEVPGVRAVVSYAQELPHGPDWPAKSEFEKVDKIFAELMQDSRYPAVETMVTSDGRVLMAGWGGNTLPALIRFGKDGLFRRCGMYPHAAQLGYCLDLKWSCGCSCKDPSKEDTPYTCPSP